VDVQTGKFGIGQPVRRVEDQRFLTGRGRYVDDIALPRQTYGVVVTSPHGHASIKKIAPTKRIFFMCFILGLMINGNAALILKSNFLAI